MLFHKCCRPPLELSYHLQFSKYQQSLAPSAPDIMFHVFSIWRLPPPPHTRPPLSNSDRQSTKFHNRVADAGAFSWVVLFVFEQWLTDDKAAKSFVLSSLKPQNTLFLSFFTCFLFSHYSCYIWNRIAAQRFHKLLRLSTLLSACTRKKLEIIFCPKMQILPHIWIWLPLKFWYKSKIPKFQSQQFL